MYTERSCVPRRRICVGDTCRGTRLVQDSGHRVAAELSPVMTHAASHRQTSGHLHVGKAGSEHSMFSCFVVSFQHTFFQETLIYCFHPSFVFLRHQTCPNMWLTRVWWVSSCAYMLHHTTFSIVASFCSGRDLESPECVNPFEFED